MGVAVLDSRFRGRTIGGGENEGVAAPSPALRRRRHREQRRGTRLERAQRLAAQLRHRRDRERARVARALVDRQSVVEGKRVSVSVANGGGRVYKKKHKKKA